MPRLSRGPGLEVSCLNARDLVQQGNGAFLACVSLLQCYFVHIYQNCWKYSESNLLTRTVGLGVTVLYWVEISDITHWPLIKRYLSYCIARDEDGACSDRVICLTDYSCSFWKGRIPCQGWLYLGVHHLGFHAFLFGQTTRILLRWTDITVGEHSTVSVEPHFVQGSLFYVVPIPTCGVRKKFHVAPNDWATRRKEGNKRFLELAWSEAVRSGQPMCSIFPFIGAVYIVLHVVMHCIVVKGPCCWLGFSWMSWWTNEKQNCFSGNRNLLLPVVSSPHTLFALGMTGRLGFSKL